MITELFKSFLAVFFKLLTHGQPWYILISEPGQTFRSQFVLYRTDIGLIKQKINKVDAVRLYASCVG